MRVTLFHRGLMVLLLLALVWSLWAGAQTATNLPATNRPAATATNQPSALLRRVQLDTAYLTFGLDRIEVLNSNYVFREPLWKYIASLIFFVLAFLVSRLIDYVAGVWLKKLAHRTGDKLHDLLLDLLHGPIKVIVLVVLLHIGLNIFDWSPKTQIYLSKALILVVAASLTYLAVKLGGLFLDMWRLHVAHEADRRFNDQLFSLMRKSTTAFIIVVAVLVTASNLGINITAAITSLSIGGLAVGLAAQDTLANLFGAVAVFADKPFQVGDSIKLDAGEGVVEAVGIRSTRIRNPDGNLVVIPNKTIGNAAITNLTSRSNIKTTMNIALAQAQPAEKVKRAIEELGEIYRGHPMTQDVWISFNRFEGANLNIQVVHWWKGTDYQKYLRGLQEMNLAVKERFDAEGIRFTPAPAPAPAPAP